jgi:hypothetical protein
MVSRIVLDASIAACDVVVPQQMVKLRHEGYTSYHELYGVPCGNGHVAFEIL